MAGTPSEVSRRSSPLLSLPSELLPEVLSWCPKAATANALLNTCTLLHALRRDPAVAALFLLRSSCRNYVAAVVACSSACAGGSAAVVQDALRLLAAHPAPSVRHTRLAPGAANRASAPSLLQAMLYVSASNGDAAGIRGLLALPQPPDINRAGCRALLSTLRGELPHLEALQALLEHGALLATWSSGRPSTAFALATDTPARAAALPLLLQHVPPYLLRYTLEHAYDGAMQNACAEAVAVLLPAMDAAGVAGGVGSGLHLGSVLHMRKARLLQAARGRNPAVLQVVLHSYAPPSPWLDEALLSVSQYGKAPCARVLLDAGANPDTVDEEGSVPLLRALHRAYYDRMEEVPFGPTEETQVHAMLVVLLEGGAAVTDKLREKSRQLNLGSPLLQNAMDAVGRA